MKISIQLGDCGKFLSKWAKNGVQTSNGSFHGKHHGYLVDLGRPIFRQSQLSSDQKPSLLVILPGCRDGAWGWGHSLDVEYQTNQNCSQRES